MSEEQLQAFLEKVKGDPSLQKQLKAEGADPVAIAQAAGFEVTTEDHQRTLSEEVLEAASGGQKPPKVIPLSKDCYTGMVNVGC